MNGGHGQAQSFGNLLTAHAFELEGAKHGALV
jgi:hypothetical protein